MTQEEALEILKSGKNVFLTSAAGCGKSFVINLFKSTCDKCIKITATSGIAARNIEGVTINSFLGIGLGPRMDYRNERETIEEFVDRISASAYFIKEKLPNIRKMDVLVIDEISMMPGYLLNYIDYLIRESRQIDEPFGGVQLVAVGDAHQLPPITKWGCRVDWFFNSAAWKGANLTICNLTKAYRQSDPVFLSVLNSVRTGNITPEVNKVLHSRVQNPPDDDMCTILETHNKEVEEINTAKLKAIPTAPYFYYAEEFGPEDEMKYLKSTLLVDDTVELKVGARVITCSNNPKLSYYNGSLATVTKLEPNSIEVRLDIGGTVNIEPVKWDNLHYQREPGKYASFTQYPVRLAYALSIHRVQGLTLDNAIINPKKAFSEGQVYVALSRVRNLENLYLRNWSMLTVKTSKDVLNYHKQNGIN